MREIKYRGKDIKTGEWVYGLPQQRVDNHSVVNLNKPAEIGYIVSYEPHRMLEPFVHDDCLFWYEVDPETVGQYTGLKDNTKWEQLTKEEQKEWLKEHTKEEWNGKEIYEGDIIHRHVQWGSDSPEVVAYENGRWSYSYDLVEYVEKPSTQWEVIGNIYETPDLMKATEKEQPE